jgi:o-succinylbenzoate---CoA ligase
MGRPVLRAVEVGAGLPADLVDAVRAALDGAGPPVLPVPAGAPDRVRSALRAALRPDDPGAPADADDVALVVPTSGSTGEPKGALLTRAALQASAAATASRLSGPGTWVLAVPATHVAGLMVLVRALLAGGVPAVVDGERFTPEAFATATEQAAAAARGTDRPLYTSVVPTQLDRLLTAGVDVRAYDAVLLGAAAAPPGLLDRARDAGARVVTTYGMTETCGGCVYDGVPLAGVTVRVETSGREVAGAAPGPGRAGPGPADPGRTGPGRIVLGGPTVAAGYRLRPDRTAESFVDGWFLTGDLGRWDGARLAVEGRLDDVVVSGGENVVPAVVEHALAQVTAQTGIGRSGGRWCVVGVPDEQWGQRVVAVLAAGPDVTTPPLPALRDGLRASLPAAWLPRQVVRVSELPMLPTGKTDRRAVADLVRARTTPDEVRADATTGGAR